MPEKIEIVTPRLVLRPANLEDAEEVQVAKEEMWSELQLWMSWAYEAQRPLEAMLEVIRGLSDPCTILWGFSRDSGAFAVATGVSENKENPGTYETGYWGARAHLGQGYATEATNAAIRYAFGEKKAKAVTIHYYEGNEKSRHIIDKLGFTPTGIRPKRHKRCSDGVLLDSHAFVMSNIQRLPDLEVSW